MIPKIKKILYTTDLSQNSVYAFYFAVDLAQQHHANIIILHAVEPISLAVMPYMEREKIAKIQKDHIGGAME